MNEKEKMESYIATCKCCLLAQAMKHCAMCRFNIGLAVQVTFADSIPVPNYLQIALFTATE